MAGDGHWMGRDGEFWGDTKSREARLATPRRSAFSSLFLRSAGVGMRAARCIVPLSYARLPVSYPRSRVPNRIYASDCTGAHRAVLISIAFMGPHQPGVKSFPHSGLPPLGKGSNVQEESTRDGHPRIHVQYPDCSPTAHHPFWSEAKLSRPLARTAEWIVFRGNARPVEAVANRIGHNRRLVRTAMYAPDG
jgi:hypothetical protein